MRRTCRRPAPVLDAALQSAPAAPAPAVAHAPSMRHSCGSIEQPAMCLGIYVIKRRQRTSCCRIGVDDTPGLGFWIDVVALPVLVSEAAEQTTASRAQAWKIAPAAYSMPADI
ncbi:hypothetical protein DPSP01_008013 [Paraphaeosphaeria sporulosa]